MTPEHPSQSNPNAFAAWGESDARTYAPAPTSQLETASDLSQVKRGNVFASTIVVIWGAGVLIYALAHHSAVVNVNHRYNAGYHTGSVAGLVFAVVLLALGGRGLHREWRRSGPRPD